MSIYLYKTPMAFAGSKIVFRAYELYEHSIDESNRREESYVMAKQPNGEFGYFNTNQFALTSSNSFTGNQTINGNLTINGDINANQFLVTTRSIEHFTASTDFGLDMGDTHTFTGSVRITGSLSVIGPSVTLGNTSITGSLLVTGSTTQIGNNTLLGNTILSGSIGVSGSTTFRGVHQLSGSNSILGNTIMSGTVDISGAFDVHGSTNFHNHTITMTASVIKQFVKSKFPTLPVWASSQTFANGNSVDINVCKENGDEFDYSDPIYSEISSFCSMLKGGRYDGMTECYEYAESGKTDNGTRIEFNAKYVSCNPKAPFGSWADTKRMLVDMMAGKYVWGVLTLEQAIKKAKSYKISDSTIEKAIALI